MGQVDRRVRGLLKSKWVAGTKSARSRGNIRPPLKVHCRRGVWHPLGINSIHPETTKNY